MIKVVKKDGSKEKWNIDKVSEAIEESNKRVPDHAKLTDIQRRLILSEVSDEGTKLYIRKSGAVTTFEIHNLVLNSLRKFNKEVYKEYRTYRDYKEKFKKQFEDLSEYSNKIVYTGDKENANKDSTLNSTKQALISEGTMKSFMKTFELHPSWIKAHEDGWIHIHDLANRYLGGINCCIFNMANLLKDGFEMNGSLYLEPKTLATAFAVVGDVTLSASAQQYGGFSIPEIDSILAPYAEKSYKRHINFFLDKGLEEEKSKELAHELTVREIEQGYQGFETKLNTVSNSLG